MEIKLSAVGLVLDLTLNKKMQLNPDLLHSQWDFQIETFCGKLELLSVIISLILV